MHTARKTYLLRVSTSLDLFFWYDFTRFIIFGVTLKTSGICTPVMYKLKYTPKSFHCAIRPLCLPMFHCAVKIKIMALVFVSYGIGIISYWYCIVLVWYRMVLYLMI